MGPRRRRVSAWKRASRLRGRRSAALGCRCARARQLGAAGAARRPTAVLRPVLRPERSVWAGEARRARQAAANAPGTVIMSTSAVHVSWERAGRRRVSTAESCGELLREAVTAACAASATLRCASQPAPRAGRVCLAAARTRRRSAQAASRQAGIPVREATHGRMRARARKHRKHARQHARTIHAVSPERTSSASRQRRCTVKRGGRGRFCAILHDARAPPLMSEHSSLRL